MFRIPSLSAIFRAKGGPAQVEGAQHRGNIAGCHAALLQNRLKLLVHLVQRRCCKIRRIETDGADIQHEGIRHGFGHGIGICERPFTWHCWSGSCWTPETVTSEGGAQ